MVGKTALNKEMKHLNGAYFRTNIKARRMICDENRNLLKHAAENFENDFFFNKGAAMGTLIE